MALRALNKECRIIFQFVQLLIAFSIVRSIYTLILIILYATLSNM